MSLKVAIYQGGVLSKDGKENLDKIDEVLASTKEKEKESDVPDIVVFPELFLGGYNAADLHFGVEGEGNSHTRKLQEIVKKHKVAVCAGWVEHTNPPSNKLKNMSLILNKEGEIILSHTKTHLWEGFENQHFVEGDSLPGVVTLCGVKISTIICYEVEFPEIVREMRNKGTEVLFVPTGVCYVPSPSSPSANPSSSEPLSMMTKTLVPCRALENNIYICYVNRAGQEGEMNFIGESLIVSPLGTIITQLPPHVPTLSEVFELKSSEIETASKRNPYRRDFRPQILQK